MAIGNIFKKEYTDEEFIEEVFELAFGNDAINRDFTKTETLERLNSLLYKAFLWDTSQRHELKEDEEDKIWEDNINKTGGFNE
tara:strand:- start:586 stop:834 length:249 start_codon:yes stop_codon:yes gene_type:complete